MIRPTLATLFLLVLFVCIPAIAQITIGQGNAPTPGSDYVSTHVGEIVFDPLTPGGNRTWNISSFNYTVEGAQSWVAVAGLPGASEFPTATIAIEVEGEDGNSYTFLRVASGGAYALGVSGVLEGDPFWLAFDEEALTVEFPMTFGSEWTSVIRMTFELQPGVSTVQLDSTLHTIDAWGNMTTPSWSGPALRDLQHEYSASYTNGDLTSSNEEWNYFWWSGDLGNSVHYSCDGVCDSPDFTNGDLSVISATTTSLDPVGAPLAENFSVGQNYPNPFNPTTNLPINIVRAGKVEITIYNQLGEVVSTNEYQLSPGTHDVSFDGSAWSSGNYFAQVRNDGHLQTRRMTMVK